MIAHKYKDGSIGEQHEVGDRVETSRIIYYGWNAPQQAIPIGTKGVVKWIKPYNENSTYHTKFVAVDLEDHGIESELPSAFKSLETPRETVVVQE